MQDYTSRNLGQQDDRLSLKTKWGLGISICSFVLICLIAVNFLPFIRSVFLGIFGLSIYAILIVAFITGLVLVFGKKTYILAPKYIISIVGLFVVLLSFLQLALTDVLSYSFVDYISNVYNTKTTPAGVVIGAFVYLLSALINVVGTYILLSAIAIAFFAIIADELIKSREYADINSRVSTYPLLDANTSRIKAPVSMVASEPLPEKLPQSLDKEKLVTQPEPEQKALTLNAKLEVLQKEREERIKNDPINIVNSYTQPFARNDQGNDDMAKKIFGEDFINSVRQNSKGHQQEIKQTNSNTLNDLRNYKKNENNVNNNIFVNTARPKPFVHEESMQTNTFNANNTKQFDSAVPNFGQANVNQYNQPHNINNGQIYNNPQNNRPAGASIPITPQAPMPQNVQYGNKVNNVNSVSDFSNIIQPNMNFNPQGTMPINSVNLNPNKQQNEQMQMTQTTPTPNRVTKYTRPSPYIKPPVEFLTTKSVKLDDESEDYQAKAAILEATLDSFKIPAKVVAITHGPAVTRYEMQMPSGISVNKIMGHSNDIAMNLSANGGIRIEAPIPGKNLVGIEVPNAQVATIGLKDIIDSREFKESKNPLTFALGKDIAGSVKICDLASMPHLLVAGSSGSGKSVCLNVLLISLLYKLGPDDLKLILIDPKLVEFTSYNGLPHLLTPTAINQPKQVLNALDWAIMEMNNRFVTFQKMKVRDFKEYNSLEVVYQGKEPKLPRIVIVIDEMCDLMMLMQKELEDKIMRLAQLARAAGIHLIIATQRPSVDVITGTIKANLPSRIAFAVTNYMDSKTILDQGGAEKLLGKGDMLYAPQSLPEPVRIQCPFITNTEVLNIVEFIKKNNPAYFDSDLTNKILSGVKQNNSGYGGDSGDNDGGNEFDPLLPAALKDFLIAKTGSISSIQRKHSVGFNRAARIVDQMERAGFISPADGTNKNRTVLITEEKYNELFGNE